MNSLFSNWLLLYWDKLPWNEKGYSFEDWVNNKTAIELINLFEIYQKSGE